MSDAIPHPKAPVGFPENVISELWTAAERAFPDHEIMRRPLRYTDPARSVGIYTASWTPDQARSMFIGQDEPALSIYQIQMQTMIQAADEEEGRILYTRDAKLARVMLYRDPLLRVALSQLEETLFNTIERLKRYGVNTQQFLNNQLQGQFVYLATTDLWVETEITKLN